MGAAIKTFVGIVLVVLTKYGVVIIKEKFFNDAVKDGDIDPKTVKTYGYRKLKHDEKK
jgi:hypothetical protein